MAFKRALWHSGLTYQQTCRSCRETVTYMDNALDFRPWFPDGFVYCPKCKTPLRHNEAYAINSPQPNPYAPQNTAPAPNTDPVVQSTPPAQNSAERVLPAFCSNCGKAFLPEDKFCSNCGNKR